MKLHGVRPLTGGISLLRRPAAFSATLFWCLTAILVGASVVPAQAAGGPSLTDVLSGKAAPLTLTLKQLDGEWRRMNISLPADATTNGSGAMEKALTAALGGPSPSTYYTRGQIVSVDGQSFLIAYRPKMEPLNLKDPKPARLSADTPLTLSLIALRNAAALDDIRPFNLQQELESQDAGLSTAASLTLAPQTPAEEHLQQIGLALLMYAQDHGDILPAMKDADTVRGALATYVTDGGLFVHPVTGQPFVPNAILGGKRYAHIPSPDAMVAFYEAAPSQDGSRAVLFLDGNVRRVTGEEWPKLARGSKIALRTGN